MSNPPPAWPSTGSTCTNVTAAHAWIERHLHPEFWRDHEATIRCPLHEHADTKASATANDERRAWYCHGCGTGGKLTDLAATLGVPAPSYNGNGHHAAGTEYLVKDTTGEVVAVHVRRDLPTGKAVTWHLPDGSTGLAGRKARTLPLYGSEQLPESDRFEAACIVEGEKAAATLRRAVPTVLALGTVTGASGTPAPDVLQNVVDIGLPIYLWPDNDDDGAKHMKRISKVLTKAGATPQVVTWPDAPAKGDAADWAAASGQPSWSALAEAAAPPTFATFEEAMGEEPTPEKPPGREWGLMVAPKEQPLAECFEAALDLLGAKLRRNLRSGKDEVHGMKVPEPADPDGWAPLTTDSTCKLFAQIEDAVGVPAWRAPPRPWRVGDKNTRHDLVTVVALRNAVDPMAAWLEGLPAASGDNPMDGLIVALFGPSQDADQDSRLPAVAMHLLLGTAVHRAYHPGAVQHVTPVLIAGWQGQGKSSLAACLLPPGFRQQWFGDGLQLNMSRKEVAEVTAGKVIVEMPEMSGLRRAELATLKSWLTTSDDGQHRGAYKHTAESQPRRWSGIATCDKAEALPHDPAGHRRWLAVAIGPKTVNDMDAVLEPIREQLWAHALNLYRDQAPKVPPALWGHVAEQNRRYEVREPIADERVALIDIHKWQDGAGLMDLMHDVAIDSRDYARNSCRVQCRVARRGVGIEAQAHRSALVSAAGGGIGRA